MRVALYLRRSTIDLQPDSLAAQEERLTKWAHEHGHEIVAIYRDSASGRSVRKRDKFLELIETVRNGAPFEAVLVRDVSRWSRAENIDEAGYYEFVCRSNGVAVIYVDETFEADASPYTVLLKSIKRAMAAEFSKEHARVVCDSHARIVRRGFWPSGAVPYGMERALVDPSGAIVGRLAPGQHKAVAGDRVRLVPGDPEKVEVVRQIFTRYALEGRTAREIADELNNAGVPGSHGGHWSTGTVTYFLRTEPYAGDLVYRIRGGRNRSELYNLVGSDSPSVIRCRDAHEPLISRDVWNAAQARLEASSWRRTDSAIEQQLSIARTEWWKQTPPDSDATAEALRGGHGDTDVALIGGIRESALAMLAEQLSTSFHITQFGDGWLLDHLLYVRFRVSLPHARLAGLEWVFPTGESAGEDVILGLGFSPPPHVAHVGTVLFRRSKRWMSRERVLVPIDPQVKRPNARRIESAEQLVKLLQHAITFRNERAEKAFIAAAGRHARLSLIKLAKELGWPVTPTRTMYQRLVTRGVALPPLPNQLKVARVKLTCPHCDRTRLLTPKVALSLDTDVCFECLRRPPVRTPNPLVVVCPRCGERRLVRRNRGGATTDTLCQACVLAVGRERRRAQQRAARGDAR